MQIVIDIDEDTFTRLFDNGIQDNEIATDDICEMVRALRLGKQMQEPKTAHWIKVQGRPHHARCDHCNRVTAYAWGMDYCPKCGRKMEVEK